MKIKTRIIGIIIVGVGFLFLTSFFASQEINKANREYSAQESITAHSSAWISNMDIEFADKLLVFDPLDGTYENIDLWDPSVNSFGSGSDSNPLFQALKSKDGKAVSDLMASVFSDVIDSEQLTFAIAYDNRGLQLYCESSLYVVGVDPCAESASPDYFLNFGGFAKSLDKYSSRKVVQIKDLNEEKPLSVNDTLSFALKDEAEATIGVIVLGRNIIDSLEMFAENFEVQAAIAVGDTPLTFEDYYDEEPNTELSELIADSLSHSRLNSVFQYSYINDSLGSRISSIPLSKNIRASELRILLFDDQSELLAVLKDSERQSQLLFAGMAALILLLTFFVTSSSFNRILEAISALEKMGEGDLSEQNLKRGWLSSRYDEVGRLQKAINEYRLHRVESEVQRRDRAKRRDERDGIMFEKMSSLSEQLEGSARSMLLSEIDDMRTALSTGTDEEKENASIEIMSKAFSKMSDEVTTLIDARTHELVIAKDEINSSIRYAAKLQNALLPKTYPGDIDINVEWRPRDLVGGDIYFIKDLPDKVYIAVVDCTGHGVPGAFLSIIARSHLDKAITPDQYQSAGQYLSQVNMLLKDTLSRTDQKNTNEEGFDGGVCIYYRDERRLEFAGAKASIFQVQTGGASETSGDRKSVGSTRMREGFEYTTHEISDPAGAFVMLTDGITDVMSPEEKPIAFGRRRVLKLLQQATDRTPKYIVEKIMNSVDLYRGSAPFRDDLTLLSFSLNETTVIEPDARASGDKL
ncbi:SpoIIE family protein phosphatase [Luminiphilus sp.]|nr:SpoIIE family protein phosphatase [Luminiphilus sp.]